MGLIFEEILLFLRNFALVMGQNFGSFVTYTDLIDSLVASPLLQLQGGVG